MRLDHLLSRGMSRGGELRGASYESDLSQASVASRVTVYAVKRHIRILSESSGERAKSSTPSVDAKPSAGLEGLHEEAKRETCRKARERWATGVQRRQPNRIGESKEIVLPLFSG